MDFGNILKQIASAGIQGVSKLIAPKVGSPQEALYANRTSPQTPFNISSLESRGLQQQPALKDPSFFTGIVQRLNEARQPVVSPLGVAVNNSPTPTVVPPKPINTPMPTRIPQGTQRIDPYPTGPSTPNRKELYPKLQTKEAVIQPSVFDAIMKNIQDDYKRRIAMATAFQESSGGLSPVGDNGRSFGPFHMMPGNTPPVPGKRNVTEEQARDPEFASQFLNDFMNYNELGVSPEKIMRRWNFNSGYTNKGPKYDVDIPRFATMAAFLRGN